MNDDFVSPRVVARVLGCTAVWLLAGCCTAPARHDPGETTASKPHWHSITMTPRTNRPVIYWHDRLNPIWWLGNADEPRPPAWYRPHGTLRNLTWYIRNPFANFTTYVIGVGDKQTVRCGRYPDRIANPNGGWNFAVTRWKIVYLPFLDYKRGRFEFYFGWRERGNFGIKLNFHQAAPRPRRETAVPRGGCTRDSPPDLVR